MTATITPVEATRSIIWEGPAEALCLTDNPDGSILLWRSTQVDDGPSRTLAIKADAVPPLVAHLMGMMFARRCEELIEALTRPNAPGGQA